jgi:diaminohydroxyphosphoribosylaminopyrimidine deaminase / 5-amino-6-(5-phosphoribosylamino)uracil reductase
VAWFHAPAVMGGDGLPAVRPLPLSLLSAMPRFRRVAARPLGEDWLTEFERLGDEEEGR